MSSIKIVLRKKQRSDGTFPVCLRITKERKTKYFNTLFNCTENEWDSASGCFNKKRKGYMKQNQFLLKVKDRAIDVYTELAKSKDYFSLDEFEKHFREDRNPANSLVFPFWEEVIAEMNLAGRVGNARMYEETMKSFKKFSSSNKLNFLDITNALLTSMRHGLDLVVVLMEALALR